MKFAEWQDFFECISKYCPFVEIALLFTSMVQFSIQYKDALDQRGDSYQVQLQERENRFQKYYQVIKQNVTITSSDTPNCHVFNTIEEANFTQNFINYFSTQTQNNGHSILEVLAGLYYTLFIFQLIGLMFSGYYKIRNIKVEDKCSEAILKFAEQSSTLVVYYFGTLLIPILSIDYSENCVSSYFAFIFDMSAFVPYVGAIVIIILGIIFLAVCCYLEIPNPSFFIVTFIIRIIRECEKRQEEEEKQKKDNGDNQNDQSVGICLLFIAFLIALIVAIIIFPTINAFINNEAQITIVCIISFVVTVISGIKDWFKENKYAEANKTDPK